MTFPNSKLVYLILARWKFRPPSFSDDAKTHFAVAVTKLPTTWAFEDQKYSIQSWDAEICYRYSFLTLKKLVFVPMLWFSAQNHLSWIGEHKSDPQHRGFPIIWFSQHCKNSVSCLAAHFTFEMTLPALQIVDLISGTNNLWTWLPKKSVVGFELAIFHEEQFSGHKKSVCCELAWLSTKMISLGSDIANLSFGGKEFQSCISFF